MRHLPAVCGYEPTVEVQDVNRLVVAGELGHRDCARRHGQCTLSGAS